jgi:hypothetical protein
MKLIGFLMVTVGFILAALAAVVDQSALKQIDDSTLEVVDEAAAEAVEEDTAEIVDEAAAETANQGTVKWIWYIPALVLGAAGVILIRVDEARQSKTEHHITARIETVESSLEKITANINKLNAEKHSIHTYDMRHRIDELFINDIDNFVDARESIAHRYGLAAYGDVMSSFAAGERYLNRVWSASADGYIDEVNTYLEKTREQFADSLKKIQILKDTQTSTFS